MQKWNQYQNTNFVQSGKVEACAAGEQHARNSLIVGNEREQVENKNLFPNLNVIFDSYA